MLKYRFQLSYDASFFLWLLLQTLLIFNETYLIIICLPCPQNPISCWEADTHRLLFKDAADELVDDAFDRAGGGK